MNVTINKKLVAGLAFTSIMIYLCRVIPKKGTESVPGSDGGYTLRIDRKREPDFKPNQLTQRNIQEVYVGVSNKTQQIATDLENLEYAWHFILTEGGPASEFTPVFQTITKNGKISKKDVLQICGNPLCYSDEKLTYAYPFSHLLTFHFKGELLIKIDDTGRELAPVAE